MTMIDLLRHGATERPGDLVGRTDCLLSEEGWRQVARQTHGRNWSAIVTSPLRRAREAAERLGAERAIPVRIDADWSEIDLGDWDGRPLAELRADATAGPQLASFYREPTRTAPPNGEAWLSFVGRVAAALGRLEAEEGPTLVVAHAGPIRAALALATGVPIGSLWALRIDPATRVRLRLERHPEHGLWGEIVEIEQPGVAP